MSAAALALLIQLAPGLLQAGVPLAQGVQQQIMLQQQVQIAYYGALAAYYNSRGRTHRCAPPRRQRAR